jgi:hypothetical protein
MANIFVHFEPTGPLSEPESDVFTGGLPPYVIPGKSLSKFERTASCYMLLILAVDRIRRGGELEKIQPKRVETGSRN